MAGAESYSGGKKVHTDRPIRMSGASWIEPQGAVVLFDDFLGDAYNQDLWLLTQSGTPTTAGAISASAGDPVAGHGGWFAGATDDVDAEADELASSPSASAGGNFRVDRAGNGMLVVEWAISIPSALTTRQYFAGFSDDATEGSGAIAINVTTTTVADAASDAAGIGFYSAATDNTHFLGVSTDSNNQSTITACATATADTWVKLRTEIDTNGDCFFYVGDRPSTPATYYGTSNVGVSPDVLLMPYFGASPTTTTAVPWEIDYCFAACAR